MICLLESSTSTGKIKKIEQNTKNRSAIKVYVDLGKDSKGLENWSKCCIEWCLS